LKKILILSYFFPPCNLTASSRPSGWAKHFYLADYYPVIVTRKWEAPLKQYSDLSTSTSDQIEHYKYDHYEVYYLPYKGNLKDRIYKKYGDRRFVWLRKALSFIELVLQNYFSRIIPYYNIYKFSNQLLKQNSDIKKVIITANPYIFFKFGYLLSKRNNIQWIADYRDDWNTSQLLGKNNMLNSFLRKIESASERKWLSTANCFTTISENYIERIASFINKKGFLVMNGFDETSFINLNNQQNENCFTILYSGTLYDSQPIEIFISAFKIFVESFRNQIQIKLVFLGLLIDPKQTNRVHHLLSGFEDYYSITDRIDKKEAINIQLKAHLFLICSHTNIKGITSSKIFDYLACKRPIILFPSDQDILDKIITKTNSGYICNTSEEINNLLSEILTGFIKTNKINYSPVKNEVEFFSQKNQTLKLASILDAL
jgi:glycosyltransferase involved in cell wall biosynthesis